VGHWELEGALAPPRATIDHHGVYGVFGDLPEVFACGWSAAPALAVVGATADDADHAGPVGAQLDFCRSGQGRHRPQCSIEQGVSDRTAGQRDHGMRPGSGQSEAAIGTGPEGEAVTPSER